MGCPMSSWEESQVPWSAMTPFPPKNHVSVSTSKQQGFSGGNQQSRLMQNELCQLGCQAQRAGDTKDTPSSERGREGGRETWSGDVCGAETMAEFREQWKPRRRWKSASYTLPEKTALLTRSAPPCLLRGVGTARCRACIARAQPCHLFRGASLTAASDKVPLR